MDNRLLRVLARACYFLLAFIILAPLTQAQNQCSVIYTETNADSTFIPVDACTAVLDWEPPMVSLPSGSLCIIVNTTLFSVSGGYQMGDQVPAGTTVFITYRTSLINPLGGNQTVNFSFTIEFVDTLAPAFTTPIADLPQDITVDCLSDIPAAPTLTATDNCGAVMVLYDEGDQPTNCQGGSFVRTWTSTDATGNVLTHTQTITVNEDITPPTITQTPQNGISTCSDAANDYVDWLSSQRANLQATDDCGIMAVTDDAPDPASIQNYCGTITVTFSITDNCGLTTTSTATFTVDENEPPTLVATAQDININCTSGSSPLSDFNDWIANHGGAVAIDNCADVIWTTNPAIPTFPDLCTPPFNAVSVEFIASDGCGQSVSTTAIFTVQDNTPPTITTQAQDAIIDCAFRANIANLTGWLQSNGGAVVNDACTAPEEVVTTYIVNGTLMNTDEVLNAFIASEQLGCQDNVVIGGNLVNNVTGNITVTFSFADPCGNSTSTTATFATVDNTPPQLIAGAQGIVVQCNANIDSVLIEWLNRGASAVFNDECGSDIVFRTNPDADGIRTIIANAPDCGNTGFALVEFYASDMCGNENPTPTTATFTIQDDTGPTFDTPAQNDTIACAFNPGNNDAALQTWLAANGNAVATDFCGNITWNGYTWVANQGGIQVASGDNLNPPTAPDDICNWILEATFKVVDDCQNQSTTTASFVVGDVLAPTIVIPADVTVSCENIPTVPAVTITDNCDDVNTTDNLTFNQSEILDGSPTERCNYQILRTWITSDACGNMQNYTQIITVQDTLPPVFQNVADVTVSCADLSSVPFPVVTDACDTNPITPFAEEVSTQNADLSICEHYNYTITRTWTAMDACGNSRDTVQVITVTDNLPPTFTTPNDVTINCTQINDMNITGEPSGLSDNCSSQTINFTDTPQPPSGDCSQGYAIIRTWVATDICGNTYSDTQTLTIIDNEAPTVTNAASNQSLACDNTTDIATAFQTWVSNHAGATATDNCSDTLMWFAAVPGSYNLQDPSTFPGTPIGGLNVPVICPNPITGVTASETVDFVVYDRCNQAAVTTATFTVTDDVPPVIVQCPQDVTINGGGATCSGMYLVVPPTFVDDCGSQMVTQSFADIKPITSALPGDSETPVDMITLSFNNIPTTPIIATGNVVLNIVMEDIDAEESTEFFVIKAEDGTVLGQTTQATSQCAQTVITTILTITATQINSWAADSTIEFTLMPNIPANLEGRYAINDICAGARVVASLSYDSQESYGVQYQYSINNGTRTTVSPITTVAQSLSSGANTITYYLTDCAGNETSCTQTVTVEDNLAPTIVCPNNINVVLPQDECGSVSVTLPLPLSITDNCAFTSTYTQTQPSSLQQQYITYTYNPNILEYIADNKLITFTNLLPNATNDVTLTFFIEADVDSIGEYFTIIGENNTNLGTTEMGQSHIIAGNCSNALRATFTIPAATYNSWVGADGILSLNAISNLNLPVPPTYVGEGINPCTPSQVTFNGDTDGSNMYAVITYSEAQPYYYITGATTLPTTLLTTTPTHDFNVGVSTVHYLVQDAVGNADTCSFTVSVIDQQTPVAVCTPQTIFINPSGVVPYTLDGQLLDGGSTDNCGIVTWNANPNVFTCEQAGLVYNVTMTVTDAAGNTASCNTPVRVETALPQPTYTIGLCGSDSLSLFANPPSAPGNVYTYQWTGPGTFASNSPNPVIPNVNANHAGSYTVMITGITGCESAGTVEVSISGQPNTPSVSQSGTACQGGNVTLNTQSYGGNNVLYQWYQGVAPNGTFVANTITPQLILNNATVGSYQYYVIVTVDGCNSNPSASLAVTVTAPPTGTLSNAPVIDICEGNLVSLGATEGGVGYTYQWSGPNGFSHTVQYPPTFTATTPSSGTYTLVVSHNGCASPIVNTIVNVTDAPPQPTIAPDLPVCFGDTLVLNTNISNGILYTWTRNGIDTYQTVTNQLRIFPITAQDVGSWTVVVQQNNCNSPVSLPVNISPQQIPNVSTTPTITACAGTAVQLSATNITGANYTWRGPDGTFYFGANPTVQPPLVEGLYVVTVTSSNNCTATASTQVNIEAPPSIVTISVSNNSCV
ncbi:MAG: HYR domain-containing protein, partial [Saprospiraceae bacterium]